MTRRKIKSTKPVGGGGARHPNSLANLIPGGASRAARQLEGAEVRRAIGRRDDTHRR